MHLPGTPETMQQLADYEDVVFEVMQYLANTKSRLNRLGIYDIIIDPGFGFGKKAGT
jgi:dihydropteroate synthase